MSMIQEVLEFTAQHSKFSSRQVQAHLASKGYEANKTVIYHLMKDLTYNRGFERKNQNGTGEWMYGLKESTPPSVLFLQYLSLKFRGYKGEFA